MTTSTQFRVSALVKLLHFLLSQEQYQTVIAWESDNSFTIKDQRAFEQLMAQKLRYKKFQSFVRQLYKRNFKKVKGSNLTFWHHEFTKKLTAQELSQISFNSAREYLRIDTAYDYFDGECLKLKNRLRHRYEQSKATRFSLSRVAVVEFEGGPTWEVINGPRIPGFTSFQIQLKWTKSAISAASTKIQEAYE